MAWDPKQSELHYDQILTNLSIMYVQDESWYVHKNVFPYVSVSERTGKYNSYTREDFFRDDVEQRKSGEEPSVTGHGITRLDYATAEFAQQVLIDDQDRSNSTAPYDPDEAATILLTQKMMIHMDKDWATAYMASTKWATVYTGAAAISLPEIVYWSAAGGVPIDDVDRARGIIMLTGFEPQVLVCGWEAWIALKNNAQIVERHKHTSGEPITEEIVARLIGVRKIVVAKAVEATSAKSAATAVYARLVSSKDALLVYAADQPSLNSASAGYTFRWTGLIPGEGNPIAVFRGRKPFSFSDVIVVRAAYGFGQVANTLGVYFSGVTP